MIKRSGRKVIDRSLGKSGSPLSVGECSVKPFLNVGKIEMLVCQCVWISRETQINKPLLANQNIETIWWWRGERSSTFFINLKENLIKITNAQPRTRERRGCLVHEFPEDSFHFFVRRTIYGREHPRQIGRVWEN